MKVEVQLNYYKDEDGEYSEPKELTFEELNEVIRSNWPNNSYHNDLRLILVKNGIHQLILKYCKRDVYEAYYFKTNEIHHYHKKSRIELIFESITLFMSSEFEALEIQLNRTKKGRKYLRNELMRIHDYEIKKEILSDSFSWVVLAIPLGIMLSYIGVLGIYQVDFNPIIKFTSLFLVVAGLYFWVPGLLIHHQYYQENKDLKIRVTKGNEKIIIKYKGVNFQMNKNEIESIVRYQNVPLSRIPWSDYGYTKIMFNSGDVVVLTSLIIDQIFILDKFYYSSIKPLTVNTRHPFLKHKMDLKK